MRASMIIAEKVHQLGVLPLILLCASPIFIVQQHAATALGNLAQVQKCHVLLHITDANASSVVFPCGVLKVDDHRRAIGQQGGIEALFLSAAPSCTSSNQQSEKTTPLSVQRSATWALSNMVLSS